MTKSWHIPRRTFLRGLGTVVALPTLEAMLPTRAAAAAAGAAGLPRRMAFVYVPNGINMAKWAPKGVGPDYELSPTLQPLAAHKSDFTVLSGLRHKKAYGNGDGGGDHARASATYLTGCQARKTAGANIRIGISVDQVAASRIGDKTRFPSLELSCDRGQEAGSCDSGYSCAYQFNISWRSENQPMNPEVEPKLVFDRLFGGGSAGESAEARARRDLYDKSVLDFVRGQAKTLQSNLGSNDRRKLDQYFTAVREVERRIARNGTAPPAVPDGAVGDLTAEYSFEQHVRLMFDLMALSFQTDTTRVATFLIAHDGSNRPYPFIGVPQGHHHVSHHRNEEASLNRLAIIDRWHVSQFGYFLDKLKGVTEGDGTLLDNCMIVYGAGIADGNAHAHTNLPTILAGRGGGTVKSGRHLACPAETPLTNLYLAMLDRMGTPTDRFGDSTGVLEGLS
jgi:hypothetical protein